MESLSEGELEDHFENEKQTHPRSPPLQEAARDESSSKSGDDAPPNKRPRYEESEYDSSDIDVDDLLEKGLKEGLDRDKNSNEPEVPHEERKKLVLKKRDQNYFEILPDGWIEVTHFSGMPVYLHKATRVCTMSKPYHLGPGSARKHEIPISAIPCFQYRKELEKELNSANDQVVENETSAVEETGSRSLDANGKCPMSAVNGNVIEVSEIMDGKASRSTVAAKVESVKETRLEKSLNFNAVREYCQKLFEFQEITIRKFKTWSDRRKHMQLRKSNQRPSLPDGTKLITCPMPKSSETSDAPGRHNRKEFVMNPAGKSSVCILHEFVQHSEREQPEYVFKELENASQPYSATVMIKGMEYGVGYGSSKKQAKVDAARVTLEILIPAIKDMNSESSKTVDPVASDLSYFDDIEITDSRVSELCVTAGQYSPYQILVECLKRNWGMGDTDIKTSVTLVKHQKNEFTMSVGTKHTKTVYCRNKREGKQRAAQAILADMHQALRSWGALLRLYGRGSCKTPKEKKEEEQKITELQSTACANRPNHAILKKLKEEMEKLREQKDIRVSASNGNGGTPIPLCPDSKLKDINL